MAKEIERKYLLKNSNWRNNITSKSKIRQGYLNSSPERVVRVRVQDKKGIITIKGKTKGITRIEYEYEIPFDDSFELLKLCESPIISKTRYNVIENDKIWEVDIFENENKGLKVAEIELESEDEKVILPNWIGEEVTYDLKYLNSNLTVNPFENW